MTQRPPGPVEMSTWPSELTAHVVTPGTDPRIHGYSVERDLARNATFPESVLLSLCGELPSARQCRVFEVALMFLAPISVAEAPTHAAVLGRICGARSSAIVGIAAVALAERARRTLERYAPLLAWLDDPSLDFPAAFKATTTEERDSVARLAELLAGIAPELPILGCDPDRTAALLGALHFAGLKSGEQLEPVFVLASLAPTLAEALSREPGSFHQYPMQLPRFEYTEGSDVR